MPCIDSQGPLSEPARRILSVVAQPVAVAVIAASLNLPLYRVRSSVRDLVEAGLIRETHGAFAITPRGLASAVR